MGDDQQEFNIKEIGGQGPAGFSAKKPRRKFKFQKKHFYIAAGIVAGIILAIGAMVFLRGWFSFSKDRVGFEISASAEISSGEEMEFSIKYKNNNRVALQDVKLILDYPQGAYSLEGDELSQEIIEIGDISPNQEEIKKFKMRLTGEKGSIKFLSARLNYQPENISSRFENSTIFKINIGSVLIGLYLTIPQKAISGEEISYILDYINDTEEDFSNLNIEFKYPSKFSFKRATPEPIENINVWKIEELKKGERGTIKIWGVLQGIEGENKTLEVSVGKIEGDRILKYGQTSTVTQIAPSPLSIILSLNNSEQGGNLNAGDKLNYKIRFENNTDVALSQLVLKAYFESEVLNFKALDLREKGFFDSLNNIITWSAAGVSALALLPPGESGEVSFLLSIKDNFSVNNFEDKNFKVSVRAELETLNVPPQFNLEKLKIEKTLESKVNSKVVLRAKGYYNETSSTINNFGPIPPQVNQLTTYTIHWQLTNASNDLENVRVAAVLPQGIEWRNVHSALSEGARLEYNERTKQIVWFIDKIPAATGFLLPAHELVFQVGLRPSITQVGREPVLIDESSLSGKDMFTEETLESFSQAIAANLPDDTSIGFSGGVVRE